MFNIKQIRIGIWSDGDIDLYIIRDTYIRYFKGNPDNYKQIPVHKDELYQTTDYPIEYYIQRREIFLKDLKNEKILKLLRHFISLHLNTVRY